MLSGYKTYIVGALMVLNGAAALIGVAPEGIDVSDPLRMIMEGVGFITIRLGITKVSA